MTHIWRHDKNVTTGNVERGVVKKNEGVIDILFHSR